MKELTKRVAFALPAAVLFLWLAWTGGWYFKGVIILIGFFSIFEARHLMDHAELSTDDFFPYTIGLWILLLPTLPHALPIGLAIFFLFVIMQMVSNPSQLARKIAGTLFSGIYAPAGLLGLLLIRSMGEATIDGFLLLLGVLLMVWGNDVFAYFGGKGFGKHLMAPAISPKKTWEGFAAGVLGACVGLAIPMFLLPYSYPLTLLQALPLPLLVSVVGPVGDLTISKLKREGGLKDTSHFLPGHGGFLDRFDSLILVAPAVYCYLYLIELLDYVSF